MSITAIEFGQKLTAIRYELRLTQKELCEKVGISRPYLSELESGKRGVPNFKTIERITNALGLSSDWFMDSEPTKSVPAPFNFCPHCGKPLK